jgi:catechol 2,3-dioxygenase-like lactoylglutathione lyase family enzyme
MKSIDIIMIPVKDRQKAKEFYLKAGFNVVAEAPGAHNDTWIQMGLPDGSASISLASFQGIICETEDIEKEIATLVKNGITVGEIDTTPWGKFAWFKDPDGNSLCLREK